MKQARDFRDFLNDIADACRAIIQFVEGMTFDLYLADEKTRWAVMHGYEIMGEAARHIPEEVKLAEPHIPWTEMAAMRNHVIHGYFGIDDLTLFEAVEKNLKPLYPVLETLARKYGARQ